MPHDGPNVFVVALISPFTFLARGSSIKYVRKIFVCLSGGLRGRIRGLEMLVFRKILRTYLMDDP